MAIWNNTVGFAAPFNPGVNVNPIDIRPFLDSTSGSGRSVSGNSGKSSGDSNKTIALYGTDLALQKEKQGVDMAKSILEQQYSSAVNSKNATEESMQQAKMDYIKGIIDLLISLGKIKETITLIDRIVLINPNLMDLTQIKDILLQYI